MPEASGQNVFNVGKMSKITLQDKKKFLNQRLKLINQQTRKGHEFHLGFLSDHGSLAVEINIGIFTS